MGLVLTPSLPVHLSLTILPPPWGLHKWMAPYVFAGRVQQRLGHTWTHTDTYITQQCIHTCVHTYINKIDLSFVHTCIQYNTAPAYMYSLHNFYCFPKRNLHVYDSTEYFQHPGIELVTLRCGGVTNDSSDQLITC